MTEIAGYFKALKEGFLELGYNCDFLNLLSQTAEYGNDDVPCLIYRSLKYFVKKREAAGSEKYLNTALFTILQKITSLFFLLWSLYHYDVYIFGFNTKIFSYYEYYLLKVMKKKVFYINFGSDSRPPFLDGARIRSDYRFKINSIYKQNKRKKKTMRIIEKNSDVILSYPPMAHYYCNRKINLMVLGIPFASNIDLVDDQLNSTMENKIRILHAPSDEHVKGSIIIRSIIKTLIEKGYPIEYKEVIGMKNSVVLDELRKCDFVIDQLWSDTPMAKFATEAAFFGKPAVVGGYYAAVIHDEIGEEYIPPSLFVRPDEVETAVEKMISDHSFRVELGKRAREFVRKNWSPRSIAEKYISIINKEVPDDWWFDPKTIRYLHGGGLEESVLKDVIRRLIEFGGNDSLRLQDKPELEKAFVDFAFWASSEESS